MPKKNDAWGIEIGADAIKAVRLVREDDDVRVADYEILPFKYVLTTPDLNVDEAIQVNLDAFLSRHDVSKSTVMVSVPGNMAFARFAKLPPVDPKKIPDIVKFEAVQQIPFPIEQVEWDYQVFQQPDSPDVEVGIFAITKDRVMSFMNHFRRTGMRVDGLTLSPLAVYNAFAYDMQMSPDDEGMILVDIGTSSTDVIIVEGGGIWLRTLPIGGNNFTEALVRAFKLSFPKAEKLKREAATSKYARQIFQAMRPVFADLVQEMQRSLGYYQSLNRDANLGKVIGVGSTFRLPGLQKFLKQQLQMEVVRPDGFKRISIAGKQESEFVEAALNMATAYGLALQGLDLETVSANLLPRHVLQQRLWKAKQPWIAAAAVLCLAPALAAVAKLHMEKSAFESAKGPVTQQIERIIGQARNFDSEWRKTQDASDPRQQIDNIRRILDYRDIWPKVLQDLSLAAKALNPQPELLVADYTAMRTIPRQQRRRVYIESVTAQYMVGSTIAPGQTPRTMDPMMEDHMGYPGAMPGYPGAMPGYPGGPEMDTPGAAVEAVSPQEPQRFVITVTGTTPHAQALNLLPQQYIKWLQDNAARRDRPYRLEVQTPGAIVSVTRVGSTDDATMGVPAAPGPQPMTARRTPVGGGRTPIGAGPPGTGFGPGTGTRPADTIENLLPAHPLAEESMANDYRFEIRWIVQLIAPEAARAREEAEPAAVAPDTEATAADLIPVAREVQP